MKISVSAKDITAYLKEKKIGAELQEDTNQPYFVHKSKLGDFAVFFRIYDNEEQLQILTFFPLKISRDRFDTIGRLLHHINKEIDLPGFGMDEKMGLVFHRIMIPVFKNEVQSELIDLYLKAIPNICEHFFTPISKAIRTSITFDEILKIAEQAQKP